jgi:hypothetical protein
MMNGNFFGHIPMIGSNGKEDGSNDEYDEYGDNHEYDNPYPPAPRRCTDVVGTSYTR